MYRVLKPRYWQLAFLCAAAVGLILLIHSWHVAESVHDSLNICIVLSSYGIYQLWEAANAGAVERENEVEQDAAEGKYPALNSTQSRYRRAIRHAAENPHE